MQKVLHISTGYTDGLIEKLLIEEAGAEYLLIDDESEKGIIQAGQDASVLIIALTEVSANIISNLPNLKLIVRAGIGVDNIDLEAARENDIRVCNLPNYCSDEVADHTVALMLAVRRKLFEQTNDIREGKWESVNKYKPIPGMKNSIAGFVGCGGIAQRVMVRLKPFGVKFLGYDPYLPEDIAKNLDLRLVDKDELLGLSDCISLHTPLTDETYHFLDDAAFDAMKTDAIVINTARGGLIDNDAMLNAMENKKIAGLGLDVIDGDAEAAVKYNQFPNVIITPHTAYYSGISDVNIRAEAGELVANYILSGELANVIV